MSGITKDEEDVVAVQLVVRQLIDWSCLTINVLDGMHLPRYNHHGCETQPLSASAFTLM